MSAREIFLELDGRHHVPSEQCWCAPMVIRDDAVGNPLKVPVVIHNTEAAQIAPEPISPRRIISTET